jgi:hypothetical protein
MLTNLAESFLLRFSELHENRRYAGRWLVFNQNAIRPHVKLALPMLSEMNRGITRKTSTAGTSDIEQMALCVSRSATVPGR